MKYRIREETEKSGETVIKRWYVEKKDWIFWNLQEHYKTSVFGNGWWGYAFDTLESAEKFIDARIRQAIEKNLIRRSSQVIKVVEYDPKTNLVTSRTD